MREFTERGGVPSLRVNDSKFLRWVELGAPSGTGTGVVGLVLSLQTSL